MIRCERSYYSNGYFYKEVSNISSITSNDFYVGCQSITSIKSSRFPLMFFDKKQRLPELVSHVLDVLDNETTLLMKHDGSMYCVSDKYLKNCAYNTKNRTIFKQILITDSPFIPNKNSTYDKYINFACFYSTGDKLSFMTHIETSSYNPKSDYFV